MDLPQALIYSTNQNLNLYRTLHRWKQEKQQWNCWCLFTAVGAYNGYQEEHLYLSKHHEVPQRIPDVKFFMMHLSERGQQEEAD